MVHVRLDRRLHGRVDPDDVLQEAFLDASKRLSHFKREDGQSFYVWLRLIVGQTLMTSPAAISTAQGRAAGREVHLAAGVHRMGRRPASRAN